MCFQAMFMDIQKEQCKLLHTDSWTDENKNAFVLSDVRTTSAKCS